jgi:hypothetical protein
MSIYATHLPVLIAIPKLMKVARVVEFGSGHFSTAVFLNQSIYPDVEELYVYENDPTWAKNIELRYGSDPRLRLIHINGKVSTSVPSLKGLWELVFVDDSVSEEDRVATIKAVAKGRHPLSVIVIHDFERASYMEAASSVPYRAVINTVSPMTGILWDECPLEDWWFGGLNELIRQSSIPPTDILGWMDTIERWLNDKA